MNDTVHVQNTFRQLLQFSRQLEGKGYCVYIFGALDEKIQNDSMLMPTHPTTRETNEGL